jgi:hypothetical protein
MVISQMDVGVHLALLLYEMGLFICGDPFVCRFDQEFISGATFHVLDCSFA